MTDDTSLNFYDLASDPCFPSNPNATKFCDSAANGNFIEFQTTLVGVDFAGNPVSLSSTIPFTNSFFWKTTYNGTSGGVYPLYDNLPADPGTGTGGIAIESINGTSVAPLTSGQSCNGVFDGTFNGNVTVSADQNCTFTNSCEIKGNVMVNGGSLDLECVVDGNLTATGGSSILALRQS